MGSASSRPDPAVDEKLVERLQAVTMASKGGLENEYVHVEEKETVATREPRPENISISVFGEWEKKLMQDPKNQLALSALSNNDAMKILSSRAAKISDTQTFNIKIPLEGSPVTSQRRSGRCWLFASTNVFRVALMRKYNLKEFQLSQAWLFFWDKIEKANYFLESIIETANEPLDSRLVQALTNSPVGDGGQWDMVANLVEKYGLVPQALYPDSYNAMNSGVMGSLITTKLREDALVLRELINSQSASSNAILKAKTKMLEEIHLILTLMLGPPPSTSKNFTWDYYDAEGRFHSISTDPISFASSLSNSSAVRANAGTDVHKLFSLVNDPRNAYHSLLAVDHLGNVWEGRGITYVNVAMKTMKTAVIAMLKSGLPVFFGCDVGKYSNRDSGIMDTALIDYEIAFNIKLGMTKAQRLRTGESQMTHAMVLTGVHVDGEGNPVKWRVENSWGEDAGTKGYFVMSDAWMDEFVYQAVVDPKFVSKEVRDVLEQDPVVLPLWDPMGALA